MSDQDIREWVQRKLEEDQSREPVKKALENQGLDPTIVDEVIQNRQNTDQSAEGNGFELPEIETSKYGKILLVLVLVGGLVFGAGSFIDLDTFDFSSPVNSSEPVKSQSSDEAEPVKVVLEDGFATPARPEIDASNDVEFLNRENHSLRIVFERNVETFTLEPGQSKTVDIDNLVYYSAEPVDTDTGSIEGSIDVQ